ncbi:winged helix-turn-helix domain-containing protein [Aerococcaceae bacterium NML160702]|nr:winged helix-turn-helix domain-containing protein [Aerococcaceae bacterium NML160702]
MDIEYIAKQLKELGHPTRLWIVLYLLEQEQTYGVELAKLLGKAQGEISQHLKKLKEVGILALKKESNYRYFSLNPNAPVIPMLKELREKE